MDTLSRSERSRVMSRVRSTNTTPELVVRRLLFSMGYRYRLHVRTLPGRPDIVFFARRKLIFVHGCFWHQHAGCAAARIPKSNLPFWLEKFRTNRLRDDENQLALTAADWQVLTVWECELRDLAALRERLLRFLGPSRWE